MKRVLTAVFLCFLIILSLAACGATYTEQDVRKIRADAYEQGYEDGYIDGHTEGSAAEHRDLDDAKLFAGNLQDYINRAMALVEDYEYSSAEEISAALDKAFEECLRLQTELRTLD